MNTDRNKSALSYVPGFTHNAVLKLILASGVAAVTLSLSWAIIMIVYEGSSAVFYDYFVASVALPAVADFKHHWWTFLTYGWFQFNGFWEFLSNILWLYCFGSVVQSLAGYRQVIPVFIYSVAAGGVAYLLGQLLPGALGHCPPAVFHAGKVAGYMGPSAGLVGLAIAAIAFAPAYRFYITPTLTIPLWAVVTGFVVLMVLSSGLYVPVILLQAGGALMGFGYVKLLRAGYRPGKWMYDAILRTESLVTPRREIAKKNAGARNQVFNNIYRQESKAPQKTVDEILDKINQKGYNSLSKEEKEILMRAGNDK